MLQDQPSKTLLRPAVLRAAHQLLDRPLILEDPLAVDLIPEAAPEAIYAAREELCSPQLTLLRSAFVLRSRFAEDCIAAAAADGVEQLVILGAGLDTFPWRQPPSVRAMRIFVTDHPASAGLSVEVRQRKGLSDPGNVSVLGIDLERQSVVEDLRRHGFKLEKPAIFTMLGLAQYLTRSTIEYIARAVASGARKSRIVMSFNPPVADLDGADLSLARQSSERGSTLGEPWLFRSSAEELIKILQDCGMRQVSWLAPDLAQSRYFANRTDDLRAPVLEQVLEAVAI